MDKVFGYKGLLRFEDAVSHVSRDFASFKSFGLILTEETLFSCCVFLPPRQILLDLELDPDNSITLQRCRHGAEGTN